MCPLRPDHQLHIEYTVALKGYALPMEELDFLQIPEPLDDVYLAVKVLDEAGLVEEACDELLKCNGPIIIVFLFGIPLRILANVVAGILDRLLGHAPLNPLAHLPDL